MEAKRTKYQGMLKTTNVNFPDSAGMSDSYSVKAKVYEVV